MSRIYFEEVQTLKNNRWVWMLVIISSLGAMLPLTYGLYWQVGKGEPWGDEPMSDEKLVALSVFMFVVCALVMWIITSITLKVKIDDAGIHYSFFPNEFKQHTIHFSEIDDYKIIRKVTLGFGHRGKLMNTKTMNVYGSKFLSIKLKNGKTVNFGTRNAEVIEMALKRSMSHHNMI